MVFLLNQVTDFIDSLPAAATAPEGLDLAVESIQLVIETIETERANIEPVGFAFEALVYPSSFGGADSAPNLGTHYSRAHEVIWKTLDGLKKDLQTFQEACLAAKNEIISADENSADRMRIAQNAVERLATGDASRDSVREHREAQQSQDVEGSVG